MFQSNKYPNNLHLMTSNFTINKLDTSLNNTEGNLNGLGHQLNMSLSRLNKSKVASLTQNMKEITTQPTSSVYSPIGFPRNLVKSNNHVQQVKNYSLSMCMYGSICIYNWNCGWLT